MRLNELGPEEQHSHGRYKRWVEIDPQQAQVWRDAWDLLLTDTMTLDQICAALAARGHRFRSGKPFTRQDKLGRMVYRRKDLSKVFHNWFYAGWVVVDNEWAQIPPKSVRATWEPVVSTEEFELGLAILAWRNHTPTPNKHNFYLLQGLIHLQRANGRTVKLTCSTPNANRTENGVSYYCVPSSHLNFACNGVDEQIAAHLDRVQIAPEHLSGIRRAYIADIERYTGQRGREQSQLEAALTRIEEKELNLWRAFTDHGMRAQMYQKLAQEYQEEHRRIAFALKAIQQENRESIAILDAALRVIAEIGVRYSQQDARRQRDILRQVVSRVVIDETGKIIRPELHSPFTYLHSLRNGAGGAMNGRSSARETKTPDPMIGRSLQVSASDPNGRRSLCFTPPQHRYPACA